MDNLDITILSAEKFISVPAVDTSVRLTVRGITKDNFAAVKAKLLNVYGDTAVTADGRETALSTVKGAGEISVAAMPDFAKNRYNVIDAMRIIARLMQKEGGCPWDSVQTHDSIRINMIEEAYEAVDAINHRDLENMTEEFGDVLLQSLLQSEIAKRDGEFDFADVCDGLCKKLITRHTFIFGDDSAGNSDDAISLWEKNKAAEKHYTSLKDKLERLPENFPSLLYAQKVHKKIKGANLPVEPQKEFDDAVAKRDFARVINAAAALLSDDGKDAEIELNALVKNRIEKL